MAEIEDDLDEWCAAIGSKSAERESDKVPQRAGLEHKQSRWKRAATTNGNASKEDAESHEAAIESDDEEDDDEMNRFNLRLWLYIFFKDFITVSLNSLKSIYSVSVYKCAEMALDRVATSIGGRYVAPLVLERIGQHISSGEFRTMSLCFTCNQCDND